MSIKHKAAVGAIAVLAALAPVAASAASFKDVPQDYWGAGVINWAADNGVVAGYPDGTFKPDNNVTEAEFLTMLVKAYHPQLPQVEVHQWADPVYAFSKTMNYPLNGYDNIPARDWVINRTRVAEIVAGAAGYNYSGRDAIHFLLAKGLAKGEDPGQVSIESYHGEDLLTRAQAVAFVQNLLNSGLKELKPRPTQPSDPSQLPPLPGQQQPPTQPQTPVQPPSQPSQPNQYPPLPPFLMPQSPQNPPVDPATLNKPHVDMNNWTPGDSTVLGKALFSNNFRFNSDGSATVTIPTAEQLGMPGAWINDQYMPPKGSNEAPKDLQPGQTYTLNPGAGAYVFVEVWGADGKLVEGYTVHLDNSGFTATAKRVNGQLVYDQTSFDALLRGLGLK